MILQEIKEELLSLQDAAYRDFQGALIPTVPREKMIGVRTPALRAMAKRLIRRPDLEKFLSELPHATFEENQLHAFLIAEVKDFDRCLYEVDRFLPYVDNWATCDQMSPKALKKNKGELLVAVERWLNSDKVYTLRFAIGMLMAHFSDEGFDPRYLSMVAAVRSEEYYVKMMVAWYFATALAKRYEQTIPYLEERRLDPWTHNKTIRKAIESYRVPPERKTYLRSLTIPFGKERR